MNGVVFQLLFILAFTSHARTMFTDPGAVPRGNATDENIQRMGLSAGQVYNSNLINSFKVSYRLSTNALNVYRLSQTELTIAVFVSAVLRKWITIVRFVNFKLFKLNKCNAITLVGQQLCRRMQSEVFCFVYGLFLKIE